MGLRIDKDSLNLSLNAPDAVEPKWADGGAQVGVEYRMNHVGCPAGEDTKKRLYMKLSESGVDAVRQVVIDEDRMDIGARQREVEEGRVTDRATGLGKAVGGCHGSGLDDDGAGNCEGTEEAERTESGDGLFHVLVTLGCGVRILSQQLSGYSSLALV